MLVTFEEPPYAIKVTALALPLPSLLLPSSPSPPPSSLCSPPPLPLPPPGPFPCGLPPLPSSGAPARWQFLAHCRPLRVQLGLAAEALRSTWPTFPLRGVSGSNELWGIFIQVSPSDSRAQPCLARVCIKRESVKLAGETGGGLRDLVITEWN